MQRRTLNSAITVSGKALFTGESTAVTIAPGQDGLRMTHRGSTFPMTIDRLSATPVHPAFVTMPPRHTSIADRPDTPAAHTVEHLLGALAGLGITDAEITLVGPEVPIGDGSATLFVDPITEVGLAVLEGRPEFIEPRESVEVRSGDAFVRAEPLGEGDGIRYTYEMAFDPPNPLGSAVATWSGDAETFLPDIAPARTFSFRSEVELMAGAGLFTGFTPRDLLVLDDQTGGPIDNALRFDDEPARHKLLDLIGDLALVGGVIRAKITAHKSGHALNHEMARALVAACR